MNSEIRSSYRLDPIVGIDWEMGFQGVVGTACATVTACLAGSDCTAGFNGVAEVTSAAAFNCVAAKDCAAGFNCANEAV
jgi:hypothetical protein